MTEDHNTPYYWVTTWGKGIVRFDPKAQDLSLIHIFVTSWNNRTYTGYSSFDGKWSIEVETPEAGGPYTITISD